MTDTQLQPGRELDVLMARVNGWAVYEEVDWMRDMPPIPSYPYIVKSVSDKPCWIVRSEQDSGTLPYWRPSLNLLHAFEVDREGWRWATRETDDWVTVELTVESSPYTYNTTSYQFNQYIKVVMWHECLHADGPDKGKPDKAAAYALARCRAVAAWWEAQP